jgi:hypothetical protein
MAYYMMQQPETVNPRELLLDQGAGYSQSYSSSAYQNAGYGMLYPTYGSRFNQIS